MVYLLCRKSLLLPHAKRGFAKKGDSRAEFALQLAKDPGDFFSTIQTGITLIGVIAGAFGGSTIAERLEVYIVALPIFAPYSEFLSVAIVVAVITYLSVVVGELVPKRFALTKPEKIAILVARPMRFIFKLGFPLVRLFSYSTKIVFRLLRIRPSHEPTITEEDIKTILDQATQAGVVDASEQVIMERALRLGARPISSLMTPRSKIIWLNVNDPITILRHKIIEGDRSVFPVLGKAPDEVRGVVQAKDLLAHLLFEEHIDLAKLVERPLFILEETSALKVLEQFKRVAITVALIVDEHGGIQGLVTMNDIIEEVIGELVANSEPQLKSQPDGSWLVDGMVSIEEFKTAFGITQLPEEQKGYYHTVGGFIMMLLGKIPHAQEVVVWEKYRFTVTEMDGRRVARVLIALI
jgi:putative hemolysin